VSQLLLISGIINAGEHIQSSTQIIISFHVNGKFIIYLMLSAVINPQDQFIIIY
jgi:putative effector of murein hydrolase LrgA (UPF0299 family)